MGQGLGLGLGLMGLGLRLGLGLPCFRIITAGSGVFPAALLATERTFYKCSAWVGEPRGVPRPHPFEAFPEKQAS